MATRYQEIVTDADAREIIGMERAALDRWGNGDPQGALDLLAPSVTYFDPFQEKRVDGLEEMTRLFAEIAGKIKIRQYDMIDPKVQQHGDIAILTYNLVDDVIESPGGLANMRIPWNTTTVYACTGGKWKVLHSHWSWIKPQLPAEVSRPA